MRFVSNYSKVFVKIKVFEEVTEKKTLAFKIKQMHFPFHLKIRFSILKLNIILHENWQQQQQRRHTRRKTHANISL